MDFGDFRAVFFEDSDFEFLYDNAADGIGDAEGAEEFGFAHLAFAHWFERFGPVGKSAIYTEVHPFAQE